MRPVFTRSAVAIATLAISSAALAATPATAATASGVTRDMVLTAANGQRAAMENETSPSEATMTAARAILNRSCDVDRDAGDDLGNISIHPTDAGGSADGVLISSRVFPENDDSRDCTVGAIATTDASFTLAGTVSIDGMEYEFWNDFRASGVSGLSGDVFVTPPLKIANGNSTGSAVFAANGNAVKDTTVTTKERVADRKSASEKKIARTKYANRIRAAKKKYAKALDQAGNSASKKAAAKASYKAERARAADKLAYSIAGYKVIEKTSVQTEARPFSIDASFNFNDCFWCGR